jgi:hypothetical protein
MKVGLTEMWCGDGMDKGRLLCTVMYFHFREVTVLLDVSAPSSFVICALKLYVERLD